MTSTSRIFFDCLRTIVGEKVLGESQPRRAQIYRIHAFSTIFNHLIYGRAGGSILPILSLQNSTFGPRYGLAFEFIGKGLGFGLPEIVFSSSSIFLSLKFPNK
jgi:hypothetical protein